MAIKAVIFDRDGVLTDFDMRRIAAFLAPILPHSLDQLGSKWIAWTNEVGAPKSVETEASYWRAFWDWLGDELHLTPNLRAQLYRFDYLDYIQPYQDARPALEAIKTRQLTTAVLSNFGVLSLEQSLQRAQLGDLVDYTFAAAAIGFWKPHTRAFLHVVQHLKLAPEECLLLDDELPNVVAANELGMRAYLVDRQDHQSGSIADLTEVGVLLEQEAARPGC
jgi:HAD superfamily hydrolase (TIGR01509 family)